MGKFDPGPRSSVVGKANQLARTDIQCPGPVQVLHRHPLAVVGHGQTARTVAMPFPRPDVSPLRPGVLTVSAMDALVVPHLLVLVDDLSIPIDARMSVQLRCLRVPVVDLHVAQDRHHAAVGSPANGTQLWVVYPGMKRTTSTNGYRYCQ